MSSIQAPANSVWSSMSYTPPRGSCNFKNGMISNKCPCLRFMLHPVKVINYVLHFLQNLSLFMPTLFQSPTPLQAATSFECDGCGHHASYHNLDNPSEDAILAKWSAQERVMSPQQASNSTRNKRKRITQIQENGQAAITIPDDSSELGSTRNSGNK
jgi:hypothetical protein